MNEDTKYFMKKKKRRHMCLDEEWKKLKFMMLLYFSINTRKETWRDSQNTPGKHSYDIRWWRVIYDEKEVVKIISFKTFILNSFSCYLNWYHFILQAIRFIVNFENTVWH